MDAAHRIRELRLDKLLTQRRLAQLLEVDQITISRWEQGDFAPSELNRIKLGRIFGVDPDEFLSDPAEKVA